MTSLRRLAARSVRRMRRPAPWRLPPPGPRDDTDWPRVGAEGRAAVYEQVRRVLAGNTATEGVAEGFSALGAAGPDLEGLCRALGGPDRAAAVYGLHARLMAIADREILAAMVERVGSGALAAARDDPAGPGSHLAWRWAYAAEAAAIALERTGDERFARRLAGLVPPVLEMRDAVVGRVDDCRGRVGSGWGSGAVVPGRVAGNVTLTGRITEPLAHLCLPAARSSSLGGLVPEVLAAVRQAIGDFEGDFVEVGDAGFYPAACGSRPEPLNHLAAFGAALLRLHDVTGDPRLLERAEALARWFLWAAHRDRHGNLVWRYDPAPGRPRGRGPEHVWKAHVTIHFVVLAAERGLIDEVVLDDVARTLTDNVFRPEGPAATIEPDREPLADYRGIRGGAASLFSLNELGGRVAAAVERLVASDPGIGGWFSRPHGLVAYARRLAD